MASQVDAGTPVISAIRAAAYDPVSPAVFPLASTIPFPEFVTTGAAL